MLATGCQGHAIATRAPYTSSCPRFLLTELSYLCHPEISWFLELYPWFLFSFPGRRVKLDCLSSQSGVPSYSADVTIQRARLLKSIILYQMRTWGVRLQPTILSAFLILRSGLVELDCDKMYLSKTDGPHESHSLLEPISPRSDNAQV